MSNGYGWTAGSDPLGTGPMDPATARATGVRITALDPVALSHDRVALREVTDALAVAGTDPQLARELLRNWTDLGRFADILGDSRSRALADDPYADTDLTAVDALFARLAELLRTSTLDPLPLLDQVSPYTAASMVAALGLDDEQLARAAAHIVHRAALGQDALLDQHGGPRAADLLLPMLAARPQAAAALVAQSGGHVDELLATASDHIAVQRLLLEATDPKVMSVADAGRVVPVLVRDFVSGKLAASGTFIADLLVPWTPQFAAGNHDWALPADTRHDLLIAALRDDDALDRFLARADRVLGCSFEHFATRDYPTKVELTSYVGMIGDIVMIGSIRSAADERRAWDLFTGAASLGASLISGVAIGLLATASVMYLQWKTLPSSPKVNSAAIWKQDVELTMLAAAQVHALDQKLRADGLIPASVPSPPMADPNEQGGMPSMGFIEAMGPWIRRLPGGEDGQISLQLQRAMFMYINPADSEFRGMEYVRGR
jgi:hypothetical protein